MPAWQTSQEIIKLNNNNKSWILLAKLLDGPYKNETGNCKYKTFKDAMYYSYKTDFSCMPGVIWS